jgi:hypothetical protein
MIPPLSWRIVWPICLFVKAIGRGRLVFDPLSNSRSMLTFSSGKLARPFPGESSRQRGERRL